MLNTIQKPISVTVHSLIGRPILDDPRNLQPDVSVNGRFNNPFKYQAAYLMDYYYAKQMNRLPFRKANPKSLPPPPTEIKNPLRIGMGPFIAITETIAAGFLVASLRTISTWINLITTLGEFYQTWAAGTDSLGDPNDKDVKKAKEAKDRREANMAGVQLFAGGVGAVGFVWDSLFEKGQDMKEVPLWKKIGLSLSSAFNGVFMLFGAAEKSLVSGISKNNEIESLMGNEYEDMKINGNNDRRCTLEWSVMTALPWLSNIGLAKNVIDLFVIYGALREGIAHFLPKNKIPGLIKNLSKSPILKKSLCYFTNPILLVKDLLKIKHNDEKEEDIICFPFSKVKKWFLGTESDKDGPGTSGFRYKYMLPVLKVFGTNPPHCYLDKSGNVVSEFYEGNLEESVLPVRAKVQPRAVKEEEFPLSPQPILKKQVAAIQ